MGMCAVTAWPVERDPIFGCLLWKGRVDHDGYGRSGMKLAHRAAWERERGAIEPGMVVDHLCRRRRCVAVHHLELVTNDENQRRKRWGQRVKRKTCQHGHDMADALVTREGGRLCRSCEKEQR